MIFSKYTEVLNYHHNPILEHCHLPNKILHDCLQLIHIPTTSPRFSEGYVSAAPSLSSRILILCASIYCIEQLPMPFLVRNKAWAISYLVESGRSPTPLHNASNSAITGMGTVFKGCGKTEYYPSQ